jgi:hypothetical protein
MVILSPSIRFERFPRFGAAVLFVAVIVGIIWAAGNSAQRTREIAKKVEDAADRINKS